MRAIVLHGEELRLEERPDPEPGSEEVLVAAPYAAVNPADLAQRAGTILLRPARRRTSRPRSQGRIVARGDKVLHLSVGDRVFGLVGGGGLADRVVVHERHGVPVLALKGRIGSVGTTAGADAALSLRALMGRRGRILVTHLRGRNLEEKAAAVRAFGHHLGPALADGRLRGVVDRVFPVEHAEDAFAYMSQSGKFGKVLLEL